MTVKNKTILDKRKADLLACVVREYVATSEPVGSQNLAKKYGLKLSSATLRNEMSALTRMGFLSQPHTSAGRVPTESGYRYFIENCLENKREVKSTRLVKNFSVVPVESEQKIKDWAKEISNTLQEGVFIGFGEEETYYTGLGYLFGQPEFQSYNLVCQMSSALDRLDEVMNGIMGEEMDDLKILLGEENPFGSACATLLLPCGARKSRKIVLGVLGPMRMDYEKIIPLMQRLKEII